VLRQIAVTPSCCQSLRQVETPEEIREPGNPILSLAALCIHTRSTERNRGHVNGSRFIQLQARPGFEKQESQAIAKMNARCALYMRVCDFLLVRNSSHGPILLCFGVTARFMCSWPHPYSILILGVFPLHQIAHVGVIERMGLKLFGREIIFEEFQPMWSRYLIVTDRRTDGRTDRRHAIS